MIEKMSADMTETGNVERREISPERLGDIIIFVFVVGTALCSGIAIDGLIGDLYVSIPATLAVVLFLSSIGFFFMRATHVIQGTIRKQR